MTIDEITLVVDTREQLPWRFQSPTVSGTLPYGDYSVAGLEHLIAIERKSFQDLLGSLTQGRERFETELKRARSLHRFFVIAECAPSDILVDNFGGMSRAHPRSIWGTICIWSTRYHPFILAGDRETAAKLAEGLLVGYALEFRKGIRAMDRAGKQNRQESSGG
jgi:DNA excision repair protein ERCC-4